MGAMWANAVETFLTGLLAAGAAIAVGALVERWRAAPRSSAPTLGFNLLYLAPASLLQALARPGIAAATVLAVNQLGGGFVTLPSRGWGLLFGFAAYFVVMDLAEYLFHRAQHKIPLLWAMHSLHHSDESFNVSTTVRHFWLDIFVKSFTIYLAVGLLFKADAGIIAVYGVVSTYNYVTHMNVRLGFGRWAFLLNAPQYHRVHHSRDLQDRDCNFAALLPIFDLLTGAYRPPARDYYPDTGLDDRQGPASVLAALVWPLRPRSAAAGPGASFGRTGRPAASSST
jgi:sterol desaturase/sphingolipid hydroxylase (fatty acid hydroxylase superfamily)